MPCGTEEKRVAYIILDRWMDGRTDGCMDGWMDGWEDGRTDGWMDSGMDGRTDGRITNNTAYIIV